MIWSGEAHIAAFNSVSPHNCDYFKAPAYDWARIQIEIDRERGWSDNQSLTRIPMTRISVITPMIRCRRRSRCSRGRKCPIVPHATPARLHCAIGSPIAVRLPCWPQAALDGFCERIRSANPLRRGWRRRRVCFLTREMLTEVHN
jgi:hypothetical protein